MPCGDISVIAVHSVGADVVVDFNGIVLVKSPVAVEIGSDHLRSVVDAGCNGAADIVGDPYHIHEICDRVAVIENGVIAESGSVLQVFTNPQKNITKEFISALLSNELPVAFRGGEIVKEYVAGSYLLLRLTFIGENADDPVLAGMIRACPVECTMLFGNLDEIQKVPFGRMIVGIMGDEDGIYKAISYLSEQDLKLEVIGYVKRNDSSAR